MTDTAAFFGDVALFGSRGSAYGEIRVLVRGLVGSATMGVAAVAAVGAGAAIATTVGIWMVGVALSGNSHLQIRTSVGPAGLALADMAAYAPSSFEAKWARTGAMMPATARAAAARRAAALAARSTVAPPANSPIAPSRVATEKPVSAKTVADTKAADTKVAETKADDLGWTFGAPKAGVLPNPQSDHKNDPTTIEKETKKSVQAHRQTAALTPPAAPIPLPLVRPAGLAAAQAKPQPKPEPKYKAASLPPAEKPETPKAPALPGSDGRTALYDISGHTVYLPDGTRLEAHSGIGHRKDNPHYVKVRMRGPTPPNLYNLTLRRRLFHGVRAIRLNPVNKSKMFGRDGMLAHTYMLGPSGQSNGCVSFKHYNKFLRAFRKGEIDRMVVVRNLDEAPAQLASLVHAHRSIFRYVAANTRNPVDY
ncbi:MAG: DUF2778 domain-containing protein [Pseudolabrys sp.]